MKKLKDGLYLCEDLGTFPNSVKGIKTLCLRDKKQWYSPSVYQIAYGGHYIGSDSEFLKYLKPLTYFPGWSVGLEE